MTCHLELDNWAYEIEKQLTEGSFTNRSRLQRQLQALYQARDAVYERHVRACKREGKRPAPRKCIQRLKPPPPGHRRPRPVMAPISNAPKEVARHQLREQFGEEDKT